MFETVMPLAEENILFGGPLRAAGGESAAGTSPAGTGSAGWPGTPGAASAEVVELAALLGRVAAVDPTALPSAQALADCATLLAVQTRLTPVLMRRLADVDLRKLHRLDDSPTTSAWVRAQGSPVPADTLTTAKRIRRFATLQDAVGDGSVSVTDAGVISLALTKLRPHLDRPDGLIDGVDGEASITAVVTDGVLSQIGQALAGLPDDDPRILELQHQLSEISCWPTSQLSRLEAGFVLLATALPAGTLKPALALLVDALLPNQLERKAAQAEDQRRLLLRPHHDRPGGHLCADLDAETFELLHTTLTAATDTDPDNPTDTHAWAQLREAGWQFGDPMPDSPAATTTDTDPEAATGAGATGVGATGAGDGAATGPCTAPRSKPQRMHDALRLALRALLDSGALGQRGKAAPHIGVTITLPALHHEPGAMPGVADSGQPLPLSLIKHWWCQAYITRFVLGLGHRVLESSHTERTLKAHERAIKRVETGGHCQGAGCVRGPGCRLIPHHVQGYAHSGRTALAETVAFCEPTHAQLHEGATITLKNGRRLNADGWVQ